jgi:PAS domain S-box-containing protein
MPAGSIMPERPMPYYTIAGSHHPLNRMSSTGQTNSDIFYLEKPCLLTAHPMSRMNELKVLSPALTLVFLIMLVIMVMFELAKQVIYPSIGTGESRWITIVFASLISVIIIYFPLRSSYLEQEKTNEVLWLQQDTEERLRKSEIQYRSFVESIEDSIYTVDCECRYLQMNARHLFRRGLSPEMYAGKRYGDFHLPEDTAIFTEQVARVCASKCQVQDEYRQNGRFYLRKLNPVIDQVMNRVIAVTVISTDITVRKNAENNLVSINRKLNLMNDITRHDMLNHLTVLYSYLALAGEESDDTLTRKYLLNSEKVIDTIHAQLLFARDYQKIGVESPLWQNISAAIEKANLQLKVSSLTIDDRCSTMEVFADPLFEKVLYNLLDNAVRYAGPQPEIRFFLSDEPGRLVLVCQDNGPGVPQKNKEKIFLRGFGKNTGLGLFLIREILAMTDISIRECGNEGEGSRFEIVIPSAAYRAVGRK